MVLLALCLAVAPQGPIHADLHPPESELYLEVGDLTQLWKGLGQAPLVQLLQAEETESLLEGLGVALETKPGPLVQKLLEARLPGAQVERWFDGVRAFSVSLVASQTEGGLPALTTIVDFAGASELEAAKSALLAHVAGHEPLAGETGVERLILREGDPFELWLFALERRLVVGAGRAKPGDYRARAERAQPGLGGSDSIRKGSAAFAEQEGVPLFWYAQSRSPLETLARLAPIQEQFGELPELPGGFDPLAGTRSLRMQLVGARFVTEMFALGAGTGTKSITGNQPIQTAWLEPIPAQSMFCYASALDGSELGRTLKTLIAKDEATSAALRALEEKLGFGVEKILGRLGPGQALYTSSISIAGPDFRWWVDCSDPEGFQADLEKFVAALGETIPGFALQSKSYRVKNEQTGERVEVPYTAITLPANVAAVSRLSLSPAFARVGDKLVFGMSSSDVKNELKRVHGGEGEPIVAGKNPLQAKGFELPADALSVVMMDWSVLVQQVLGMVKAFGLVDATQLPDPAELTRTLRPTFHYSRKVEGGIYRRNEASFGPETWLVIAGLAASRTGGMSPVPAVALDPTGMAEAARDRTPANDAAFETLSQGLERYRVESGSYPESAEQLTQASPAHPDGYLPGRRIPLDGWGRPLRYERTAQAWRSWSVGANGIDEGGAGDDVLPSPKK
jgi:hypothetical protein